MHSVSMLDVTAAEMSVADDVPLALQRIARRLGMLEELRRERVLEDFMKSGAMVNELACTESRDGRMTCSQRLPNGDIRLTLVTDWRIK